MALDTALNSLIFGGNPGGDYTGPNYNLLGTTVAPLSSSQKGAVDIAQLSAPGQFSLFNPSVGGISNILQGNFPDFFKSINPEIQGLVSSLWGASQPQLEQGVSAIESQATGFGQGGGVSTPAAGEIGNLYKDVLSNVLNSAMGVGANQYSQNLGLQGALAQLGLQQPGQAISQLTGVGGLEQGTAQNALTSLYQQFLQQSGMSEQDIQTILSYVLGGVQIPSEQPTQFGPSPFQELTGAAGSLLPFFLNSGGNNQINTGHQVLA